MRIEFYEDATGKKLVTEFLDGLDIKMRQKMLRSVKALQEIGIALRMPLSEYLEDDIFELRAKLGSNISRVLYFFVVDDKAVLTHGFIKKTQKTPKKEIQKAKDIREEYLKRQKSKKEGEKNG